MTGRALGSDARHELSLERLLARLAELSGVTILPSVHAQVIFLFFCSFILLLYISYIISSSRMTPAFFAQPFPFTTDDIFAMEPRVKRMTSWLDPRAFQVNAGMKEEAEATYLVRFSFSFAK